MICQAYQAYSNTSARQVCRWKIYCCLQYTQYKKKIITSLQLPVYQRQKDMAGWSIYQKLPLRIIARKLVADLTSSIVRSLFLPAFNTYIKRMEKAYTSCDLKYNKRMEKPYKSCDLKYNKKEQ